MTNRHQLTRWEAHNLEPAQHRPIEPLRIVSRHVAPAFADYPESVADDRPVVIHVQGDFHYSTANFYGATPHEVRIGHPGNLPDHNMMKAIIGIGVLAVPTAMVVALVGMVAILAFVIAAIATVPIMIHQSGRP